jgi:hypothetical protein
MAGVTGIPVTETTDAAGLRIKRNVPECLRPSRHLSGRDDARDFIE